MENSLPNSSNIAAVPFNVELSSNDRGRLTTSVFGYFGKALAL